MLQALKLSLKSFSKKNRAFWISSLILTLVTALLFLTIMITQIHQQKLLDARGNIYGYFYSIVYLNNEDKIPNIEDTVGQINVLNCLSENSPVNLRLGYANSQAKNLMYRGSNIPPSNINNFSCVISESLANQLQIKESQDLVIGNLKLKVESICKDIGHLWIKGETESKAGMGVPNIWINKETWINLLSSSQLNYRLLLLTPTQHHNWIEQYNLGHIYENTAIIRDSNLFIYRLPRLYFLGQKLILIVFVIILLSTYLKYARNRYNIYSDLGLINTNLYHVIRLEIILISVFSFLLSLIAISIVTLFYVHCTLQIDMRMISIFTPSIFMVPTIAYFIAAIFILLLAPILISQSKQQNKLRLMIFTHMKVSGLNILSYSFPLLLLLSFFATSTIGSILHVHSFSQSFYSEGQVPQTYDLELRFNSPQLPPYHYLDGTELKMARDQNTAVLFPFTYHDQILNKLKLRFENLIDVERVLSYSVQDDAMLVIPEDVLDSKFFTIQAQKINFVSGVFTESIEGINEKNFSPCRVVSYPESQLREIASICNLDSSSLEQLLLGNGVLLISPSLKIEEEFEDGGILYSRTSEGENLLSDPHLKEYETMKLYLPQAKQQLYGFISQDELVEKQATFHAIDVNILGNTTKNIAWFDVLNERPLPYRIVVADNFWKNNKLKQDISRLHIFYKNHVNTEDLATTIRNMSADIPNLVIKDQHYNIETWHEYQIVEKWFLTISTIFFVLTLIIFSISICRAFILHNERNFILYRDLGLSRRRIISICLLRFFPFAILSLLILLVLSEFVWINIIDGWFLFSTLARVAFIFFTVLIYFICYSISALIECSSLMNSKTYSE